MIEKHTSIPNNLHCESLKIIQKAKRIGFSLELLFNCVQNLKEKHRSKVFLKEILKAKKFTSFDESGVLQNNLKGFKIKIVYSFLDKNHLFQSRFVLW